MNRFIQFNDETVDTQSLLLYERLGRALADAQFLELTERKLLEFRPKESIVSMSVFWRHRPEEVMHLGRLSDVYLLSAGFWSILMSRLGANSHEKWSCIPYKNLRKNFFFC